LNVDNLKSVMDMSYCQIRLQTRRFQNIIIIIALIKQIDKMQSFNRDELINVFEKHSVYIVSVISLYS